MAMFGNFSELPFLEIVRLLRERRGRLVVRTASGKVFKLFLQDGALVDFLHGDVPMRQTVAQDLLSLSRSSTGSFEFMQLPNPLPHTALNLPLESLESWLSGQDTQYSEVERYTQDVERLRDSLPHVSTLFVPVLMTSTEAQAQLKAFLERWSIEYPALESSLLQGVSAEQLSSVLSLPLEHAQLTLYRLQQAGALAVKRVRAEVEVYAASTPAAVPAPARKPGLLARLLGALGLNRSSA